MADINTKIKPHQFYNHYPDNREITTKAGLCKNLWTNCSHETELRTSEFFPRCYDLADSKQVDGFIEDFNSTAIMSIVKVYAEHFEKDRELRNIKREYDQRLEYANPEVFKTNFKQKHY